MNEAMKSSTGAWPLRMARLSRLNPARPEVCVSRWRGVTSRRQGRSSTPRANSGSTTVSGVSGLSKPRSTQAMKAAAVTGLVMEATLHRVSAVARTLRLVSAMPQ